MTEKILIVEDNLDHDSIVATNGRQAVDMAAAQLPDLIMQRMDNGLYSHECPLC